MFQRILVALDQDQTERLVFDQAIALAQVAQANLMLLHAIVPFDQGHPSAGIYPDHTKPTVQVNIDLWEHLEQSGLQHLQTLTTEAAQMGLTVEFTQSLGDPGRIICELAQQWQADLIIVGRQAHPGWEELLLGSVSNYVMHHAPCSVLTMQSHRPPVQVPVRPSSAVAQ